MNAKETNPTLSDSSEDEGHTYVVTVITYR